MEDDIGNEGKFDQRFYQYLHLLLVKKKMQTRRRCLFAKDASQGWIDNIKGDNYCHSNSTT
jgi:hypothetical protein